MSVKYNENSQLGEKLVVKTLSSGGKCYIIPRYDDTKAMAAVGFNFGSSDIKFKTDEVYTSVPGVAHFIEHKLFEQKWGNAFEKLDGLGVNVNAFTDFNKTVYYFSGHENFYSCLEVLLDFVQNPYFTDESVEREKGIISQEILMYEDDPGWKVYFNMLKGMYFYHEVKENIAGTVRSIQKINKEMLYKCYEGFYRPENMIVVVCGNVDSDKVIQQVENSIMKKTGIGIKSLHREEPDAINEKQIIKKENVTVPQWCFGFKQEYIKPDINDIYGTKILMDILFGKASVFYDNMFKEGFLDDAPSLQYMYGRGYNACVLSGVSKNPYGVADGIRNIVKETKKHGIEQEDFISVKNKHIGRFIRGFNSIDAVCMSQLEIGFYGFDLLRGFEAVKNMDKAYIDKLLENKLDADKSVLSVIESRR